MDRLHFKKSQEGTLQQFQVTSAREASGIATKSGDSLPPHLPLFLFFFLDKTRVCWLRKKSEHVVAMENGVL